MKKFSFFLACALSMMACHAQSQAADSVCTLTGDIRGLGDNWLLFTYNNDDTGRIGWRTDTIMAHKGHFVFSTRLRHPVVATILGFRKGTSSFDPRQNKDRLQYRHHHHSYNVICTVLLDSRSMYVSTRLDSLSTARISNDPLNDTMRYLRWLPLNVYKSDTAWRNWRKAHPRYWKRNLSDQEIAEKDRLNKAMTRRGQDSLAAFIISHPSSYASLYSTNYLWQADTALKIAVSKALDTSFRHIPEYVIFEKSIHRQTTSLIPGDTAPEVLLTDTSGRKVALSSFRGRYTLVDFWASWCAPCRSENPNVVAAYKKYHRKGLEIYSISLDSDKSRWMAAIAKDKLKWTQVSDLKGWLAPSVRDYHVSGIPSSFLLDRNGKIIAMNLRGKDLRSALSRILK